MHDFWTFLCFESEPNADVSDRRVKKFSGQKIKYLRPQLNCGWLLASFRKNHRRGKSLLFDAGIHYTIFDLARLHKGRKDAAHIKLTVEKLIAPISLKFDVNARDIQIRRFARFKLLKIFPGSFMDKRIQFYAF